MTANARPLAILGVALCSWSAHAQVLSWNAGADMVANESSVATETINPSAVVPEWSYGWRTTVFATGLTLFSAGDHQNAPGLEGFFYAAGSGPGVKVNTGATNIVINNGPGPLGPLAPGEMLLDPSFSAQFTVVRWTAPGAGTYAVTANWRDLDPYGGNGASADLVVNGVGVFNSPWANGGSATLGSPLLLTVTAGDRLDFIVGALGEGTFDSTAFNATITAIPEPPLATLLMGVLGLAALLRRRFSG